MWYIRDSLLSYILHCFEINHFVFHINCSKLLILFLLMNLLLMNNISLNKYIMHILIYATVSVY